MTKRIVLFLVLVATTHLCVGLLMGGQPMYFFDAPRIQGMADAFGNINAIGIYDMPSQKVEQAQSPQHPLSSSSYNSAAQKYKHSYRKWAAGRGLWQKLFPNLSSDDSDFTKTGRTKPDYRKNNNYRISPKHLEKNQDVSIAGSSWYAPFYAYNFAEELARGSFNEDD